MKENRKYSYILMISMAFYCSAQSSEKRHQTNQWLGHKSVEQLVKQGIRPQNNELNCLHQKLTTLTDLPKFIHTWQPYNLTTMNVSHNHLQDESLITVLKCAHNLQHLDFSHNEVHQLCTIPPHEQLQKLVLNDNHIKKLCVKKVFGSLKNLVWCLLNNNLLSDDDITDKQGYYPTIETIWFDHTALKESTIQSFIKIFPNLYCELMPGNNAIQKQYTQKKAHYDIYISSDDYIKYTVYSSLLCAGLSGFYGFTQCTHYYDPIIAYVGLSACMGMLSSWIATPVCIKLYSKIGGYYITDPAYRYYTEKTRNIRPYPSLLGHRHSYEDVEDHDPGQEDEE